MLSDLDSDQKEALDRAAECRRKADAARFADVRDHYLDMEKRWLRLAESYAFAARIRAFVNDRIRKDEPTRDPDLTHLNPEESRTRR